MPFWSRAGERAHLEVLEHRHAREDPPPLGRLRDADLGDRVAGQPLDLARR